ncbi:MAG: DivIVA domain-containing protein [Chthonomonadales bacterium]
MRVAPIDILHKRFPRSMRGYRPDAVEEFLQEVAAEYEAALAENMHLKQQAAAMERELQRYRDMETALHEALVLANKAADDLRRNAQREAQLVLEQAHMKAKDELEEQRRAAAAMEQERERFTREFRALLMAYLAELDAKRLPSLPEEDHALVQGPPLQAPSLPREDRSTPRSPASE